MNPMNDGKERDMTTAARVYVVMGHDEERGWAVAAYTDKEQAEACSEAYQAEADSELEFYRVKELTLNV